jgi:radical SAM protein with 4Fe4S-binding SPASM domain
MVDLFRFLKVVRYRYDIFLKPLPWKDRLHILYLQQVDRWSSDKKLRSMEIGLSYRCQLSCEHCGVDGQQRPDQRELSLLQVKDLLKQAAGMGVYLVVFAGGEPLIREDLEDCLRYARQQGMITGLSTNGLLLDAQRVHAIKRAGINFINISVDSPFEDEHDLLRGRKGCFKKAWMAVRECRANGVAAIVSTYATRANVHNGDLRALIAQAREEQATGVRILLSASAGKWWGDKGLFFKQQDLQALKAHLDPCFVYVEGVCNEFTECAAALSRLIYVSPYGDVQPCSFVPVSFGNIEQQTLSSIFKRMREHGFFSLFKGDKCMMCTPEFFRCYQEHAGACAKGTVVEM